MAVSRKCARCGGNMVQGVTIDHDQGMRGVSKWLEGSPVKGWFGLKLGGRKPLEIETWRCGKCGILESYVA